MKRKNDLYDAAIVGAGPAGLSAALVLGRCCRHVVVFDHGRPRNSAAQWVNCYLGAESLSPASFRAVGRRQAGGFGVEFRDAEVTDVRCTHTSAETRFVISSGDRIVTARKLLLATGTRDELPAIDNLHTYYGKQVHHCPYCDAWEHRGERIVAVGEGSDVVELALQLRAWSDAVTACSNGAELPADQRMALLANGVTYRKQSPVRCEGDADQLRAVVFADGTREPCDALFFSSGQSQHADLAKRLGCKSDQRDLLSTHNRQSTEVPGLFLAGDACGGVQFAIVAAAAGAVAGAAINAELQQEAAAARTTGQTVSVGAP